MEDDKLLSSGIDHVTFMQNNLGPLEFFCVLPDNQPTSFYLYFDSYEFLERCKLRQKEVSVAQVWAPPSTLFDQVKPAAE